MDSLGCGVDKVKGDAEIPKALKETIWCNSVFVATYRPCLHLILRWVFVGPITTGQLWV